ncbi:hypothetical protein LTR64_002084 [Lithohypha guttulata]|uniref:uncharacterized protein n=1 Tax=Lithohypha guttulata TaxID=1690604 RepID=UPI002DE03DB6|nr:hypothetical protein LTR51_007942 [Lithohypha guttulata]
MAEALAQNSRLWDLAARNSTLRGETRFHYRQGAKYSMSSKNALVHVRCYENGVSPNGRVSIPLFPDFSNKTYAPISIVEEMWAEWIQRNADIGIANLLWVDLPRTEARRTSLGAIVIVPRAAPDDGSQLWGCSIDARWADTNITSTDIRRLTQGEPRSFHINGTPLSSWLWHDYYPRITIRSTYARYLDPYLPDNTTTVFRRLCTMAGLSNSYLQPLMDPTPALEAILNLLVVNGLVRLVPTVTVQGTIANWNLGHGPWWREFMPATHRSLGWGGNAYNITQEQVQQLFRTQMTVTAKGYAYAWDGSAVDASMAILAIYVTITLLHVCLSISVGITSSSWDSPCELIALAANSVPPHGTLQNTGAGISRMSTLEHNVRIEAKGSVLQLSFSPDAIASDRRVEANTLYG